jgi:hypothetical protein
LTCCRNKKDMNAKPGALGQYHRAEKAPREGAGA